MDKKDLVAQLTAHIVEALKVARVAMEGAVIEAREGATPAEKREDSRTSQENAGLARGHNARIARLQSELMALEGFKPGPLPPRARIAVGALVEVEDGDEGRTFFLAPSGAGVELTGPGGDGYLSVVTPSSPVGRAVLGRTVGDSLEVVVGGEPKEWTVTFVG